VPADAAEHTALTALTALQGQNAALQTQLSAAQAAAFDPAKHIDLGEYTRLNGEYVALSNATTTAQKDALVADLIAAGKLTAGQKPWALSMDLAGLKAYGDAAPVLHALKGKQTDGLAHGQQGADPAGEDLTALTAEDKAVAKQLGMTEADFAASKAKVFGAK
jgi:phage I-like protein